MSPLETSENIKIAINAALSGGDEILKVYESDDFDVTIKSDQSPLTKADKAAHNAIVKFLENTPFPILSEEGKHLPYEERKDWEYFWLVDPLDGTKEFIKRNGEFTVNIALIQNNTPIGGVVYVPVTDQLYYNNGSGSFLLDEAKSNLQFISEKSEKLPLAFESETYKIVGSRSHMSDDTLAFIETIDTNGKEKEIVSKGSSLKICMVAEGKADIYPRLGPTMEWDTAAGHAIVLGAGKSIRIHDTSSPLIYNKENLLNPYFIVN